jgi:hypothetical protein
MPIIINKEDVKISKGKGWTQITVADAKMMGAPAMVACRWVIEAGAQGPKLEQGDTDQLLYVILRPTRTRSPITASVMWRSR